VNQEKYNIWHVTDLKLLMLSCLARLAVGKENMSETDADT